MRMVLARWVLSFVLPLAVVPTVLAQSNGPQPQGASNVFAVSAVGSAFQFGFQWMPPLAQANRTGGVQSLDFRLLQDDVRRGDAEFDRFDNQASGRDELAAAQEAVAGFNTSNRNGTKIVLTPTGQGGGFELERAVRDTPAAKRELEQFMTTLTAARQKAVDDYVFNHFYLRFGGDHVMPDHTRIAARYAPALATVAAAVQQQTMGMDQRQRLNWVLGFLQSIPYDELNDRFTSNGAGFETPYGMFYNNKGDCDTKAVALAALLRRLYPQLRIVIVYVPKHAFVGATVAATATDIALNLDHTTFVLSDPTGPAFMPAGKMDPYAMGFLTAGTYSYREVP